MTCSSASSDSTQSPAACSIAKFFWATKPGHGRTHTRSVNSRASATVLSVDSASTTTISSAHAALSRQARSRASSFHVITVTDRRVTVTAAGASHAASNTALGTEPGHRAVRALERVPRGAVGAVALRARRAVEAERGRADRGGQVERAGVAGDHSEQRGGGARRARRGRSGGASSGRAERPSPISRARCDLVRPPQQEHPRLRLACRAARRAARKCATGQRLSGRPRRG